MDIVHVSHRVPVLCLTRSERPVLAARGQETPVVLREADPVAFKPAAVLRGVFDESDLLFYRHEGRLWLRLEAETYPSWGEGEWVPFHRDTLADYLSGKDRGDRPIRQAMARHFGRTPLAGLADLPEAAGPVLQDGGAMASAALVRFFDEGVRIAGRQAHDRIVYVRACGPLVVRPQSRTLKLEPVPFPREGRLLFGARPDRFDELLDIERQFSSPTTLRTMAGFDPGLGTHLTQDLGFKPELLADDDIDLFANAFPCVLLRMIEGFDRWNVNSARRKGLGDSMEELRHWAMKGLVGAIFFEEHEAVVRCCLDLHARMPEAWPGIERSKDYHKLGAYAEQFVLPRLTPDPVVDQEDEEALGGLGL